VCVYVCLLPVGVPCLYHLLCGTCSVCDMRVLEPAPHTHTLPSGPK
jgi:hypothetical protein